MNISKDVILDLLPLYEAGEVSPDTRALVEAYLKEHPELKSAGSPDALFKGAVEARPEHERRSALQRTRSLLVKRQLLFGVALACSLLPFAIAFDSSHSVRFIWGDAPGVKLMFTGVAIGCWIGFWRVSRRLRVSGM